MRTSAGTSRSRRTLREALARGEGDRSLASCERLSRASNVNIASVDIYQAIEHFFHRYEKTGHISLCMIDDKLSGWSLEMQFCM